MRKQLLIAICTIKHNLIDQLLFVESEKLKAELSKKIDRCSEAYDYLVNKL